MSAKSAKNSNKRRRQKPSEKDAEEKGLESFLFGTDHDSSIAKLGSTVKALSKKAKDTGELDIRALIAAADTENSDEVVVKLPAAGADDEDEEDQFDVVLDRVGADQSDEEDGKKQTKKKKTTIAKSESAAPAAAKPAWVDEDDAKIVVNIADSARTRKLRATEQEEVITGAEYAERLRKTFNQMAPSADWAQRKAEPEADEETEFLRTTQSLVSASSTKLAPGQLETRRLKDANFEDPSKAVVQTVEFHPNGQVLHTSGLDKTIRLFQVDGKKNAKIQSVFFDDMPVRCSQFTPDGREIIASGRRKHFYSYDVTANRVTKVPYIKGRPEKSLESFVISPDGRYIGFLGYDGTVILVSAQTKQWVGNMKMNGNVRAISFSPDGSRLYSIGSDMQVYLWDVGTRRCIHKHAETSGVHARAMAVSRDGQYYAVGADSGVINVYSTASLSSTASPQPYKSILNLTTPVDGIKFNHDSQMMMAYSSSKKDQLKMIHCPSFTTFANWPTSSTPLHYVSATDFSPHSGYMAIGNDRGSVLLYRLVHYPSA